MHLESSIHANKASEPPSDLSDDVRDDARAVVNMMLGGMGAQEAIRSVCEEPKLRRLVRGGDRDPRESAAKPSAALLDAMDIFKTAAAGAQRAAEEEQATGATLPKQ